ncbi:MAG TPA: HYR domain-containing protein, partial [Acidimicrobiales bacterium]
VKSGPSMSLRVTGRFMLQGVALEVVEGDLTLTSTSINGSLTVRPVGGGSMVLGGWAIGGVVTLVFAGASVSVEIANGTVTIPGWGGTVAVDGSWSVPPASGSFLTLALPPTGLRMGATGSPFYGTGAFRISFTNNVGTLSVTNGGLLWRDGSSVVASATVPSLTISTNGSVSASLSGFAATSASGFSFTVPSLALALDASGANARVVLGAGSLALPGLPALATPSFTLTASGMFERVLVADELDLGLLVLRGRLTFARQAGAFSLSVSNSPALVLAGLTTVPLPEFVMSSDGTFTVQASFPALGPGGFRIIGGTMTLSKTGRELSTLSGLVTGASLLLGAAEPMGLPALEFDHDSRIDKTFTLPGWDLGPQLRLGSTQVRLRHLSTGVIQADVINKPSVSSFAGSSGLSLDDMLAESDGTFSGTITGRLGVLGFPLATATLDLRRDGDAFRMELPSARRAAVNIGFATASVYGWARSDGAFDFMGTAAVSMGITGFSFSGTLSVDLTSTDGVEGSFSGLVCIGICGAASGALRSDGRVSGLLRVDLNKDGDFRDLFEVDASWRVYLKTGAVWVDINRDGDYEDVGDIAFGVRTDADATVPSMTQPPNIVVTANVSALGTVRVYYTLPSAYDGALALPVVCTPAPGSLFSVGTRTVNCAATDRAGNTRTRSFTVTVVASTTATTPTATNGATVVIEASGFLPGSLVVVTVYSTPVPLGVFTADEQGRVVLSMSVPEGLAPGEHTIVIEGFDPRGNVHQVVQPIIVRASPTGSLPPTGYDPYALILLAFVALLLGAGALWVSRRAPDSSG